MNSLPLEHTNPNPVFWPHVRIARARIALLNLRLHHTRLHARIGYIIRKNAYFIIDGYFFIRDFMTSPALVSRGLGAPIPIKDRPKAQNSEVVWHV